MLVLFQYLLSAFLLFASLLLAIADKLTKIFPC
jgi:hypothetical protein